MKNFVLSTIIIFIFFSLITCDLFKPGFGEKVDLEPPVLTITSSQNGEYVSGIVVISGTYVEDTGIKSIDVSLDQGSTFLAAVVDEATKAWSYQLNSTQYADGERNLIIRATDTDGKTSEKTLLLRLDNTPPMVLIKVPQFYEAYEFNGDFSIKGEATDTFGILSVEIALYDPLNKSVRISNLGSGTNFSSFKSPGQPDLSGKTAGKPADKIIKKSTGQSSSQSFRINNKSLQNLSRSTLQNTLAEGTNSWSYLFKSNDYITVSGDYAFIITARDNANNTSTTMFHYNDVLAHNNQQSVTIESLYRIFNGETVSGVTITKADLDSIKMAELTLAVNQALDVPEFIISNPDGEGLPQDNVLSGNAKALGMVLDDDGVNPASIKICLDPVNTLNPDDPANTWVDPDKKTGSGLSIRWEHDLSGLGEGAHTLWLRAADIYNNAGHSTIAGFFIDLGAPAIAISYPAQGAYLNNDFTLTGTATDGESVSSVAVSLDNGATYNPAVLVGEDWSFDVTVPGDGTLPVKVKATDSTAKEGFFNLLVIVDTTPPVINFITPLSSSTVNGEVFFKGTANDDSQLSAVELKIGLSDPWIELIGIYNWDYTIDSMSYANGTHATDQGGGVWKLDVQARVTDLAGNPGQTSGYYILIDNDMDKPTVNIVSPSDGQNIGGPVLISGTAIDDDGVYRVEMQIDINGDGDYNDQIDIYNGSSATPDGDTNDKFENETLWYVIDGTNYWTEQINTFGELYETEPGHNGKISIRVRAVDTKDSINPDIAGNYQEISITLDNTIPRIENLSHASSDYVKGIFTLTGDALDDQQVNSIQLSYNGGTAYTDITANGALVTQNGVNDYSLHISINTANYIPTSGILYLRLKVIDNANYQTITYINLNVDNLYPTGNYTGVSDDIYGSTTNARIQGTATDAGTVNGIAGIHTYFIRGGNVFNPATGATAAAGNTDFGDGNGVVAYTANPAYKILIDNHNEFGNDGGGNGDSDGFNESISLSGNDYNWWTEFNSAVIPDGSLEIHYVIFDNAGNGHHYAQAGFIKNNKPVISSLTIGSDVDLSDAVEIDERFTYTAPVSARNRLYLAINATDNAGIAAYAVYHDPAGANTLVQSVQAATLDISGYDDGATSFLCRVTDTDGIVVEATINITIANADTVNPALTFDTLTAGHATNGHIEIDGTSSYDGTDADVSGELSLSGSAWDNQRMSTLAVTIENFNAGSGVGSAHTVANWSGGQLVSVDPAFTINSQSLSEAAGHNISWTYVWDTSEITGSAGNNIDLSFTVADFASRTDNDGTTLDVVPYITEIETYLSDSFSNVFARSALGSYPVLIDSVNLAYETVTVYGYNLNATATGVNSDVRLSTDTDGLDGGGSKIGTGLSYANVAADYTQLDATIEVAGSGYLNVIVNGIPTINNINSNTNNAEATYINANLYDDRYLSVWDINQLWKTVPKMDNSIFPSMAMNGDTPVFAYVNNVEGYGQGRYWDGTMDKKIIDNWDLFTFTAVDLNSAGNHAVLFDINVVNGNYGDYNSGNYGGILTSFYYDVPDHTWGNYRFMDNHLWLENLVDVTVPQTTAVLDRYRYPDMVVNGTTAVTNVFYSVYDRLDGRLIFRTFRVGTDNTLDNVTGGRLNNQGTALYTDVPQYDTGGNFPDYNTDSRFANSNWPGRTPPSAHEISTSAGEFSAVACTSDASVAMILYYDESGAGSLVYKYNATPTNDATWSAGLTLASGIGCEFMDMTVDSSDHIHIAYYDSYHGDVKYVYIPAYDSLIGSVVDCTVDSYLTVGEKLTIAVSSTGIPFISYKGMGHSAKVAWQNGALADGTDNYDMYTGAWEVQILPAQIKDSDSNRFNIGLDTQNLPVVGYTNSGVEYMRLLEVLSE